MLLTPGARLGPYEIRSALGAGGMGEVYRAHDHELGRDVAIKVLPSRLANDPERVARLRREAKVLASLNHPNIAQIYGIAEDRGSSESTAVRGLVLELVEGVTLADRLLAAPAAHRALDVSESLRITRQIADALEAAHARGIIHRDLKPANIKITSSGIVKVLDFGVAKIATSGDDSDDRLQTSAATREGVIVGTASYMSPEQARGLNVDRRTDVWAFGCVLYELLTGRRAFDGATTTDSLAAVIGQEPEWQRLPPSLPTSIRRLLVRCLQKDPDQRFRDIGDIRLLIDDALSAAGDGVSAIVARGRQHARWIWAAGALALAIGVVAWLLLSRPAPPAETLRVSIMTPGPISAQLSGAISPDGRQLAFVATGPSGKTMLWARPLDSLNARELAGTERAAHPFWSPDGRSMGFIADGKLKRIDIAGGPVQIVADSTSPFRSGATWSRDGVIVFSPSPDRLAAVPAAGGSVTTVVTADATTKQAFLTWPDFLPDGRHFLFYASSAVPERSGVYVGSLDSKETKQILTTDIQAKYAEPGYLLFPRGDTLMAQPFDASRLETSGEPVAIADGVWFARTAHHASFSVSKTGTLAYVNASQWDRQLVWFDRGGRARGSVEPPARDANGTPQLSADGARVAVARGEYGAGDIWILDATHGTPSRVTFSPEGHGLPVFSGDGRRLLFQTGPQVIVKDLITGSENVVIEEQPRSVADWSRDGRFLLFARARLGADVWAVDLKGDRRPFPYLETAANETQAQLSPDGRWVAYTSNESGRDEVYVQRFPMPGSKRQISSAGGAMPRWRRDGKELFYLAADQFLTAVPIRSEGAFEVGPDIKLFRTRLVVQGSESSGLATAYDASPDGQRFLLDGPPEDPGPPMTVVFNWLGSLKK